MSRGYITANANEVFPELAIRYLLLDFGSRDAAVRAAGQLSFASNVEFTAAHQALILEIARAYFPLDGVDATLRAARQTLARSQLLRQSAEALYARGLGTVVNTALAQRGTAQARFDIAAATAARHEAMYALLSAMDLPPQTRLRVQDSAERPLAAQTRVTIDAMMHDALGRRPDLLADLARLRATEAGITEARSEFYPKLSVSANVQGNIGELSVDSRPYQGIEQPQAGVFLHFDWPLYQGGLLRNRLRLAQSREAEAETRWRKAASRRCARWHSPTTRSRPGSAVMMRPWHSRLHRRRPPMPRARPTRMASAPSRTPSTRSRHPPRHRLPWPRDMPSR